MKEQSILLKAKEKIKIFFSHIFANKKYDIFTYQDVLDYFHQEKSNVKNFKNTAIIAQKKGEAFLLQLVFLDENQQVITGKNVKAKKLDEDLIGILNDKSVVIFS